MGGRESLEFGGLRVGELNWLTAEPPADGTVVHAQLRYRAAAAAGRIRHAGDALDLELDAPALAVAPGQSAVFFDGNGRMLGGGRIATAWPARAGSRAGSRTHLPSVVRRHPPAFGESSLDADARRREEAAQGR